VEQSLGRPDNSPSDFGEKILAGIGRLRVTASGQLLAFLRAS
jgi:hypothetical protein